MANKTPHRKRLEESNKAKKQARAEHIAGLDPLTLKPNALAKAGVKKS